MTGAMYAAIAGLRTHMQNLNVIGNNIANINTFGYKAGRSVFQSALYSQIRGGSDGSESVGGRNPAQVGYGVSMGSVDIDMSTGTYSPTSSSTDCMLDGDGFFLIGGKELAANFDATDPDSFTSLTLTRVGDFSFKSDGYLSNHNGDVVYGFLCIGYYTADNIAGAPAGTKVGDPMFSDQLVPIRTPRMETAYVNTATGDPVADNITEDELKKGLADGTITESKTVHYPVTTGDGGATVPLRDYDTSLPFASLDSVTIDENSGLIYGTLKDTDRIVTIGVMAVGNVTNPNGVTQISNTAYKAGAGAGDLSITLLGGANKELGINYVNGSLAPADAELPEGSRVNSAGVTKLMTSGLEMSKTDLATEIANMITTQRGYQANTRIITVTDSMLEELVNMKR